MGKTVLYLGISLDGYLADRQGGVGWLEGQRPSGSDYGYQAFYSRVGLVVMGYNTYRQVKEELSPGAWPYDGVPCLVCTHRPLQDPGWKQYLGRRNNGCQPGKNGCRGMFGSAAEHLWPGS